MLSHICMTIYKFSKKRLHALSHLVFEEGLQSLGSINRQESGFWSHIDLVSNPSTTIHQLCDLGQLFNLSGPFKKEML